MVYGSFIGCIEGFINVKELYGKIVEVFCLLIVEVMFCILNIYKVDMDKFLGG